MFIELLILTVIAFAFGTLIGAGVVYYVKGETPAFMRKEENKPLEAFGARPATTADYLLYNRAMGGRR